MKASRSAFKASASRRAFRVALLREVATLQGLTIIPPDRRRFPLVHALLASAEHARFTCAGRSTFTHRGLRFRTGMSNLGRLVVFDAAGTALVSSFPDDEQGLPASMVHPTEGARSAA